jgi:hypothetical protein
MGGLFQTVCHRANKLFASALVTVSYSETLAVLQSEHV